MAPAAIRPQGDQPIAVGEPFGPAVSPQLVSVPELSLAPKHRQHMDGQSRAHRLPRRHQCRSTLKKERKADSQRATTATKARDTRGPATGIARSARHSCRIVSLPPRLWPGPSSTEGEHTGARGRAMFSMTYACPLVGKPGTKQKGQKEDKGTNRATGASIPAW